MRCIRVFDVLTALGAFLVYATPGFATDLQIPANKQVDKSKPVVTIGAPASVSPSESWTGLYVGISGTYNLANLEFNFGNIINLDGFGARGYGAGAILGYNFAIDAQRIWGIEATGEYTDTRIGIGLSGHDNEDEGSIDAYARTDWSGALSLKYGYLPTPNTMIFATLGATVTHALASYTVMLNGEPIASEQAQDIFYGLAFGGIAMETRIGHGFNLRLDYTENLLRANLYNWGGIPLQATPNIGTGKVALVYAFGGPLESQKIDFTPKWDGPFIGSSIGIDHGVSRYDLRLQDEPSLSAGEQLDFYLNGFGSSGVSGNLLAGYNVVLGKSFLVGIETDLKGSSAQSEYAIYLGGVPTGLRGGSNWSYGVKARAGYLFTAETLGFVYGGISRNASTLQLLIFGTQIDPVTQNYARNTIDFGVGLETFLNESTSVRIDYGVSRYDTVDVVRDEPQIGTFSKFSSTGTIAYIAHF